MSKHGNTSDEWLDLGDFADVTCWIEPSDPTPPEPDWRRPAPEFRGMRIMMGDRWEYDLVRYTGADGVERWRKIRFGESRGRR